MAEFVNVDQKNIDEQIKKINGFNRQNLKIHVILDYTEFSGEDTNDSSCRTRKRQIR